MSEQLALLQTDVVDSTRIGEALGDEAMSAVWAAHDRLARDLLRDWRGREIDKSDGFLLIFDEVEDAVGYADAYHRAIAGLKPCLLARAAIHFGTILRRETPRDDVVLGAKPVEIDGMTKPLVGRLMAMANGGQTLLSQAARERLSRPDHAIQAHGFWRFRGVAEPTPVFGVGGGARAALPPAGSDKAYQVAERDGIWMPVEEIRTTLPRETDAFVGREEALVKLHRTLETGARLTTMLGAGGAGKTRLAKRFGWLWLGDFPGGVWFCDLTQARSIDGFLHAVAQGLDCQLGRADPVLQLGHAIVGRGRCLLIFDNFEQIAHLGTGVLTQWLEQASTAQFLVTSREKLRVRGEVAFLLSPLSSDEGVNLFLDRSRLASNEPRPGEEVTRAVRTLVNLLDGLPLAIELLAARSAVMDPQTLVARMGDRFRLLTSRQSNPNRQSTLRAAFDWSWDLLTNDERSAFAQLSVFEGGISLDAAETVLDLSGTKSDAWVVDVVQSLVEKSLLKRSDDGRFDLLSTLKEYAGEQLRQAVPDIGIPDSKSVERRHFLFFDADEQRATRDRCIELDNLVAACRRAIEHRDLGAAIRSLEGAWSAIRLRGPFRSGVQLASDVCSLSSDLPDEGSVAHWLKGEALRASGQIGAARECLVRALEASLRTGDVKTVARCRTSLGFVFMNEGRAREAHPEYEAALDIARGLGERRIECDALCGLGNLAQHLGDLEKAEVHFAALLETARASGDRRWQGGALGNLALLHASQGKGTTARGEFELALGTARELGDQQFEGNALCNLGLMLQSQGEFEQAESMLNAASKLAKELGHVRLEAVASCNLGILASERGRPDVALEYFDSALRLARVLQDRRSEGQFLGYAGMLHSREGRFDMAREALAASESLLREVGDRVSLGVSLCASAEIACIVGDEARAQGLVREAKDLAAASGTGLDSELGRMIDRAVGKLQAISIPVP